MNKYWIAAAGLTLVIAMPISSIAQGRHDEKPHGMMGPAQGAMQHARPATGGRHDEGATTHGMKSPTVKKEARERTDTSAASAAQSGASR